MTYAFIHVLFRKVPQGRVPQGMRQVPLVGHTGLWGVLNRVQDLNPNSHQNLFIVLDTPGKSKY